MRDFILFIRQSTERRLKNISVTSGGVTIASCIRFRRVGYEPSSRRDKWVNPRRVKIGPTIKPYIHRFYAPPKHVFAASPSSLLLQKGFSSSESSSFAPIEYWSAPSEPLIVGPSFTLDSFLLLKRRFSYSHSLSQKERNKLKHALNGNIFSFFWFYLYIFSFDEMDYQQFGLEADCFVYRGILPSLPLPSRFFLSNYAFATLVLGSFDPVLFYPIRIRWRHFHFVLLWVEFPVMALFLNFGYLLALALIWASLMHALFGNILVPLMQVLLQLFFVLPRVCFSYVLNVLFVLFLYILSSGSAPWYPFFLIMRFVSSFAVRSSFLIKYAPFFKTTLYVFGFLTPLGFYPVLLPILYLFLSHVFHALPVVSRVIRVVFKIVMALCCVVVCVILLPLAIPFVHIGPFYTLFFYFLVTPLVLVFTIIVFLYLVSCVTHRNFIADRFGRGWSVLVDSYSDFLDIVFVVLSHVHLVAYNLSLSLLVSLGLRPDMPSEVRFAILFRFIVGLVLSFMLFFQLYGVAVLLFLMFSPLLVIVAWNVGSVLLAFHFHTSSTPVLSTHFWHLFFWCILCSICMVVLIVLYSLKGFCNYVLGFPKRFCVSVVVFLVVITVPVEQFVVPSLTISSFSSLFVFRSSFVFVRGILRFMGFLILEFKRFVRLTIFSGLFGLTYLTPLDPEAALTEEYALREDQLLSFLRRGWISLVRRYTLTAAKALDDLRIPEFIQSRYKAPTLESIRSTYRDLKDFGFPIDQNFIDSLDRPDKSAYLRDWGSLREKLLGTSNFALGFSNVKVAVHQWLGSGLSFMAHIPGYIHTTTFTGVPEEINSTSRYWGKNEQTFEEPDALLDDVWELVKAQYANSKLSSFWEIFKNWRKRFNMGFGFGYHTPSGRLKQFTRQQVIDVMGGGKSFLSAMKFIYKESLRLHMLSPVFTKWESLKLKKSLYRLIRSVVGSAFSEYVGNTVFNLKPNHNYKVWDTPMKVGMSINGISYNRLWHSIAHHTFVWAGDMTAFDSSQSPAVVRLVAGIRKKGFRWHRDSAKICEYIDIAYENLITQPLGFKNFGDIAVKEKGATTGHSSTSSDNSLMLVINYMFAWRYVTGKRAREFMVYNTLANFGDDHVLGYEQVYGWNPAAMIHAMAQIGTIMRDEAPGQCHLPSIHAPLPSGVSSWRLAKFSFLSKKPLPLTLDVLTELRIAGVEVANLSFATCHDPERLKGKLAGQSLLSQTTDPLRSYQALLSYIDLCSHHKDLYDELVVRASAFRLKHMSWFVVNHVPLKLYPHPPSYNSVLRKWYSDKSSFSVSDEHVLEPLDSPDLIVLITDESVLKFVHWLSDIPTVIVPRYGLLPWVDRFQMALGSSVTWPLLLVGAVHGFPSDLGAIRNLISRTPYAFLRSDLLTLPYESPSIGSLYFRHWIFSLVTSTFTRSRRWSMFDWLRLIDSAFVNLVWFVSARVCHIVYDLDMHLVETLLVCVLSQLHVPLDFNFPDFDVLVPSNLFGQLISYCVNLIAIPGGDLQPFLSAINRLNFVPKCIVVAAPTGTGKSTRMMINLVDSVNRRVVVILPRRLLVLSIVDYMRRQFPKYAIGGSTEGMTYDSGDRLVYCTAQSFWANSDLRMPGSVFVLDEAHIYEPTYELTRRYLSFSNQRVLFMTATPPDTLSSFERIDVPIYSSFTVQQVTHHVDKFSLYFRFVVSFVNDRSPSDKILVFVTSKQSILDLAKQIRHRCCGLSSDSSVIDPLASVYITTSVSDAGLTIPDVNVVISPDFDVTFRVKEVDVVSTMKDFAGRKFLPEDVSTMYYFKLSQTTITQRKGRTGRTSNGVFILVSMPSQYEIAPDFGLFDYLCHVGIGAEHALQHIQPDILAKYNPSHVQLFVKLLGKIPGLNYSHYLWYNKLWDGLMSTQQTMSTYISSIVEVQEFSLYHNVPIVAPDLIDFSDLNLPSGLLNKPLEHQLQQVLEPIVPEDPWGFDEEPGDFDPFGSVEQARVPVSGDGLLCGARCIQGLIYTHHSIAVQLDDIVQLLRSEQVPIPGVEPRNENFDIGQIRDFLLTHARIAVSLRTAFGDIPSPNAPFDSIQGIMFHEGTRHGGHYTYFGLPLPSNVEFVSLLAAESFMIQTAPPSSGVEDDLFGLF